MNQRTVLAIAAFSGALGVGIGAFGAHALKEILLTNGRAETYELAVRYLFYHTFALFLAGVLWEKICGLQTSAILFISGIVIFSGSLLTLSLTNQTWWGAVTPLGGLALIAGWLSLFWKILKSRP